MNEKPQSFTSKSERSLTLQLDTVVIEVSSFQVLRVRSNPHAENIQGQTFAIRKLDLLMVIQDFTVAKLVILA